MCFQAVTWACLTILGRYGAAAFGPATITAIARPREDPTTERCPKPYKSSADFDREGLSFRLAGNVFREANVNSVYEFVRDSGSTDPRHAALDLFVFAIPTRRLPVETYRNLTARK